MNLQFDITENESLNVHKEGHKVKMYLDGECFTLAMTEYSLGRLIELKIVHKVDSSAFGETHTSKTYKLTEIN